MNGSAQRAHGVVTSLALVLPWLLTVGCANHESAVSPGAVMVRTTPASGATGVALDAPVVLEFASQVERATAESGFHLLAEGDLTGSCSMMGGHGTMEDVMRDPAMLEHMDQFHSTHGSYHWNTAGTVCTFDPDSLMHPGMRYMVHMSGDMVGMMEHMGGCTTCAGADMMIHFETTAGR